jgi:hypothetical protein
MAEKDALKWKPTLSPFPNLYREKSHFYQQLRIIIPNDLLGLKFLPRELKSMTSAYVSTFPSEKALIQQVIGINFKMQISVVLT